MIEHSIASIHLAEKEISFLYCLGNDEHTTSIRLSLEPGLWMPNTFIGNHAIVFPS